MLILLVENAVGKLDDLLRKDSTKMNFIYTANGNASFLPTKFLTTLDPLNTLPSAALPLFPFLYLNRYTTIKQKISF